MQSNVSLKPSLRFQNFSGEWKIVQLSTIYSHIRNGFVGTATPYYVEDGHKYIQGKDIQKGKIRNTVNVYVSDNFYKKHNNSILKENDLVMVQSGHVGECAVVTQKYNGANCHAILIMSASSAVVSDFFKYYFYSPSGKKSIFKIKTGNTVEHILASDMQKMNVPVTSFKEQQKIASFLSSIDEWIEIMQAQVSGLQRFKRALLKKVFTQEVRFQDYKRKNYPEWKRYRLGELFTERNERDNERKHQLLSIKTHGGVVLQSETKKTDSSNSDKSKYKVVKIGDIAYNTMRMWQGASGVSKYEGIVSPAYTVIYPKNGDPTFYGYLFKYRRTIFNFYRYSQGLTSDTWNLKFQHLSEIEVTVPSDIEEQRKISKLFVSLDELISYKEKQCLLAEQWRKWLLKQLFV